ncbi:Uncharacterised protein [Yersinia rohdei]|nr:Uncharacterised protein [Yersinia rohdei]
MAPFLFGKLKTSRKLLNKKLINKNINKLNTNNLIK